MSIDEKSLKELLLAQKNYLASLSGTEAITEDNSTFKQYISDIVNKQCNLTCTMEPGKYIMVTQDQYICTLIVDLYVAPEFRRQGIGTKLVRSLDGPVKLKCHNDNPAKEFYKKLGFEKQDWESYAEGYSWWFLSWMESDARRLR